MRSVDFELDLDGLRELMKSSAMKDQLSQAAASVASIAGPDYGSDVHDGSYVAIGTAFPDSLEAVQENEDENTLMMALGASGLPQSK